MNHDLPTFASQPRSTPLSSRGSRAAFATSLAAALLLAMPAKPALANGFAPINIWNSSHCLDNATENASKLQMWKCDDGSDEKWLEGFNTQTQAFTFINQRTGRCIAGPAAGAGPASVEFCDAAAPNQQWQVFFADNPLGPPSGWYDVWQNVASGLCLSTNSVANGTVVQLTPCDPSDHYDRWHAQ